MKQKYRRIFSFGKTLLLPLICSGAIPILAQTTELPTETEKNTLNSEQETSLTEKQLTSLLNKPELKFNPFNALLLKQKSSLFWRNLSFLMVTSIFSAKGTKHKSLWNTLNQQETESF